VATVHISPPVSRSSHPIQQAPNYPAHANKADSWKENTSKNVLHRLETDILPILGKYPIAAIKATMAPVMWIDMGIGRKIVQWLEMAIIQESELLSPAHPLRVRVAGALGRLVGVGDAEAHELELQVEAASEAFKK
jgi:hypothetical protein